MPKSIDELQSIAKQIRREIVVMIGAAKSGHPGGSLSAVEILVELYFNHMHIDPKNPTLPDRDRFILSKGHAAPVLYSVMAEAGYQQTPVDQLNTLRKLLSLIHISVSIFSTVSCNRWSKTNVLSRCFACGAITSKLAGHRWRVAPVC